MESAGRVGHVDQVEPHGRVADQVAERPRVVLADVFPGDADVRQHDAVAPGQGMAAGGGHDLGHRPARPAMGPSRARFSSVAAPRLIDRRYLCPSAVYWSIWGTMPTVLIVMALAAIWPP